MPGIKIILSPMGTPLAEGGTSDFGHMYYQLVDDNGTSYSYGFATRTTKKRVPGRRCGRALRAEH